MTPEQMIEFIEKHQSEGDSFHLACFKAALVKWDEAPGWYEAFVGNDFYESDHCTADGTNCGACYYNDAEELDCEDCYLCSCACFVDAAAGAIAKRDKPTYIAACKDGQKLIRAAIERIEKETEDEH